MSGLQTAVPRRDVRVIGLIGGGHFMSHFYILALPPLFPLLKTELAVGYGALGLLVTVFNITSGLTQIPLGFLVDRFGPRRILLAGLVVEALCFVAMGLSGSYLALLAGIAVAGVANSVYHPADYAILSASVAERRMGRAFSLHTFAGYAGNAAAPLAMVLMAGLWNWQAAVAAAGVLGLLVAALLWQQGSLLDAEGARRPAAASGTPRAEPETSSRNLLLSPPILMCFLFFMMLAMSSGGLSSFAVAALVTLHQAPLTLANGALTGFLVGNALGILAGGVIADRTRHHERVAMLGFAGTAVLIAAFGIFIVPLFALVPLFAVAGFLFGLIMPSRDMLVRRVTPPDAMGRVFGFVSTGLNVGAAITPAIAGLLMDAGAPRWLFFMAAGCMLLGVLTVFAGRPAAPRVQAAR